MARHPKQPVPPADRNPPQTRRAASASRCRRAELPVPLVDGLQQCSSFCSASAWKELAGLRYWVALARRNAPSQRGGKYLGLHRHCGLCARRIAFRPALGALCEGHDRGGSGARAACCSSEATTRGRGTSFACRRTSISSSTSAARHCSGTATEASAKIPAGCPSPACWYSPASSTSRERAPGLSQCGPHGCSTTSRGGPATASGTPSGHCLSVRCRHGHRPQSPCSGKGYRSGPTMASAYGSSHPYHAAARAAATSQGSRTSWPAAGARVQVAEPGGHLGCGSAGGVSPVRHGRRHRGLQSGCLPPWRKLRRLSQPARGDNPGSR